MTEVKGPVVGGLTVVNDESARDDYNTYKRLLQNLEYLRVQEDYIKDELHNLKKEYRHAQEEVRPSSTPSFILHIVQVSFSLNCRCLLRKWHFK